MPIVICSSTAADNANVKNRTNSHDRQAAAVTLLLNKGTDFTDQIFPCKRRDMKCKQDNEARNNLMGFVSCINSPHR